LREFNQDMNIKYKPVNTDIWGDDYFKDRNMTDKVRLKQFDLDRDLIYNYVNCGKICDVGCSTGEFIRRIDWRGECYGMEINEAARSAASDVIKFNKNIFTESNYFDLVLFRGTIQHVDEPFRMIKESYDSLVDGGYLVFLMTPNVNSILYRLKKNLPLLDFKRNYYLPGDAEFINALTNYGFDIIYKSYPYIETPYANPLRDIIGFIQNVFSRKFVPHPFWGSIMNIVAQKNESR